MDHCNATNQYLLCIGQSFVVWSITTQYDWQPILGILIVIPDVTLIEI